MNGDVFRLLGLLLVVKEIGDMFWKKNPWFCQNNVVETGTRFHGGNHIVEAGAPKVVKNRIGFRLHVRLNDSDLVFI